MLTIVLLAVIAGLSAALLLLWRRLRKLEQAVRLPAIPAAPPPMPAPTPMPEMPAPTPQEAYDPDATRVHIRPPLEASHAVLTGRQGAASPSPAGAHLVGMSGLHKGHKFAIAANGTTIGRSRTCDIVLADARVSSHHAWIGAENGKMVLRDLESTNGTFLNTHTNESISAAELVTGDTIFFGSHQGDQFRFVLD